MLPSGRRRSAPTERLFQHPDFEQAILRASEHFADLGLRPAIIEKDYYVTEALRIIAETSGSDVIFKGGTSLSKGWNLIQRFSEDIDLFLDPLTFEPALGKNGIDRELKKLRNAVNAHKALTFLREESKTIGGFGRSDCFEYEQRFGGPGEIANRVLKLFAIHGKIEIFKRDGTSFTAYARHYYDLFQLAGEDEVLQMLRSDEYAAIKADYDRISSATFSRDYLAPPEMSFANSEAIFPPSSLSQTIGAEYEQQCGVLCFDEFPKWAEVLARFEAIRDLL